MSAEMRKHIDLFKNALVKQSPSQRREAYDDVLDLYNKVGLKGMSKHEIDFLKTNGQIGQSLTYLYDSVLNYLKRNNIPYRYVGDMESWAPGFGMLRHIRLEYDQKLYDKLKSMLPYDVNNIIPFVQNVDNKAIRVFLINPQDYEDFTVDEIGFGDEE
jgi:hypothetical protein